MKTIVCISILIVLFFAVSAVGQTIGSEIYPTEDELYEAYLLDQINYQTFLNLREIINSGIDNTNLYLLEEIPNINFFPRFDIGHQSDFEQELANPSVSEKAKVTEDYFSGSIKWKRYQKLNKIGRDKNRIYLKSQLSEDWSFKLNGLDEYIGRQEFSFRSLNYKSQRGAIKKLVIGNYTARFGLGLTVGYRGRLLDKDYLALEETFLFPDYGGFNGIYAEGGPRKNRVKWLFHYDKNDTILVRTSAININKIFGSYRVEGSLLGAVINNRLNKIELRQYQLGLLMGYSKNDFEAAVEVSLPKNNLENPTRDNQAALAKIAYKRDDVSLKFSAWHYGSNFINLFGGGRSGDLYRTVSFDAIDLSYRDRRNNQRGFLVKSATVISETIESEMLLSVYGGSRFERFIEIQASLGKIFSKKTRLRVYYELLRKEKLGKISNDNSLKLEYNYKKRKFSLRSFLGYTYDNEDKNYLSFHFRTKLKSIILKEIEFWVNFSRINIETGNIDYFYGYIREKVDLTKTASLAIRYRYRFNRRFTESDESTIYLETKIVW